MNIGGDFPLQLQLRPSESTSGLDIPRLFRQCQSRLQNNRVLRPANGHGLNQHFRRTLIRPVKLPHPAQVPGGEAGGVRVSLREVFGGSDSGAFLRSGADELANLAIQFHLRRFSRHQSI